MCSDDNNLSMVSTTENDFLANLIHDSSFSKFFSNLLMTTLTRPVHLPHLSVYPRQCKGL